MSISIKERIAAYVRTSSKKSMPIDEKIEYLNSIKQNGIQIDNLDRNFISDDGVIVVNVIENLRSKYKKSKLNPKQVLECENVGVSFNDLNLDNNFKINTLKSAKESGYNIFDFTTKKQYCNGVYCNYIHDLRSEYKNYSLNNEQIKECRDNLQIVIEEDEKRRIAIEKMKRSAAKNILLKINE